MGQIVKIEVEYRRTVQPQQFESKSAAAIIGVAFKEDETPDPDAELSDAFDMAVRHVHEQLGLETKPATRAATKKTTGRNISDNPEDRTEEEPAKKPAKRGRPKGTKAKKAEEPAATQGPREIADGEIVQAVTKKVEELRGQGMPDANRLMKALIASFEPKNNTDEDGNKLSWQMNMIPQERRAEFLEKVNSLGD